VAAFCAPLLARGEAVCFHCAAGISRSATMLLAVLMRINRM
jgi:protein-tyrosine phosphatase